MLCIFVKFALIVNLIPHIWTINSTENTLNREHKVHNIVLYPDKHSWCKATPIVQVVGHPGCNAIKTDNNVCMGACFSYIVPRTIPETPGDVLPYCDSCQPGRIMWKKVTLECTDGTYKNQSLTKYVEYIHDCNCSSCKELISAKVPKEDVEMGDNNLDDSLNNADYSLNSSSEVNQMSPNCSQNEFKTIISGIFKTLNNEDESVLENAESKGLHRNVWKNLLEKVETSNNSFDTSNFDELVKSVEGELKVKFNYKRLKQALLKLKKYENITKRSNLFNKSLEAVDSSKESELSTFSYLKSTPRSSSHEIIQQQSESHRINVASHLLKPVTSGSEISYHGNGLIEKLENLDTKNQTTVVRP